MIILSIDYGDVRTGIAVCDKSELLARPVTVIKERNPDRLADRVAETAKAEKAEMLLIGLPKNMDGSEGFRAEAARDFGEKLRLMGFSVEFRDERLTTMEAHRYLNYTDTRGNKRKATVDALSAVLILEDYIAYKKNTGAAK